MLEKEEQINIKEIYGKDSILEVCNFIKEKNINTEIGLTTKQVQESIQKYGNNEIEIWEMFIK